MRKQKKLIIALAASLVATPILALTPTQSAVAIQQQVQTERLVSLGGSLNAQQAEQTKQLLGAANVPADRVIYVDGNTINRFLQDGSNASTSVYSSALIEKQAPGFGVQVQIVTPQNITLVKPVTYQNAAITSGAKDVLIKIATVTPVTGEGALAGVYALLEKSGVQVDQKAVKVAEKEIKIVEQVKQTAQTTDNQVNDNQVNKIISDIKKEVTVNVTNNTEVNVTQIVQNVVNNNTEINLTQENVQQLEEFASEFAQTEAAKDEATITQLEKSIELNLDRPWLDVLSSIDQKATVEELLAMERKDYSDASLYHPIIPALFNRFYQLAEQKENMQTLYSHTFIVEKMLPNLTKEAKQALNQLRVYIYQYAENDEEMRKSTFESAGLPYVSLRDAWIERLNAANNWVVANPTLYEIFTKVALSSGFALETSMYQESQTPEGIQVEVRWDSITHANLQGLYVYVPETQALTQLDQISGNVVQSPAAFDFKAEYGVEVVNGYVPMNEIPANYRVGEVEVEQSSAEESAEQPVEETTEQNEPATEIEVTEPPAEGDGTSTNE